MPVTGSRARAAANEISNRGPGRRLRARRAMRARPPIVRATSAGSNGDSNAREFSWSGVS